MFVSRLLTAIVERCRRHARLVVLAGLVIAAVSGAYAANRLGVSTDTDAMFSENLPWRRAAIAFDRDFPQFRDLLVVVIDGSVPEQAEVTAAALADLLRKDHVHFNQVRRPDASPFFAQEGLLFLDLPQLAELLDRTIDAQPFLGQLAGDPSARGLFAALALLGMGVEHGQAELGHFGPALEAFHRAMADATGGHAQPLSWARLLSGGLASLGGKYRFVLVQPKLDYNTLEPGGVATRAIRVAAEELEFVRSGAAHVRITGSVALADEEFATVAEGAVEGLAASLVLITLWLLLAVRSWRLIVPILLTLILGLMLTLLFAALAVGTLNLVSVGFGILFVGIAVDFAIQFSVRYREARHACADPAAALGETARQCGVQILVAAAATAAGFLSFVPTHFRGVAELGLIAGVGMLIAFVCTLTFLPAAIALFRPRAEPAEVGFAWAAALDPAVQRGRGMLLAGFAAVALLGAALVPRLTFDADPLHTKNASTEAMRTLRDLLDSPLTNPYTIDILARDAAQATALAARLRTLPLVAEVLTVNSLIPEQQVEKLALIADANGILAATLAPRDPAAPVTPEEVRLAARAALAHINKALPKLPQDHPLVAIAGDLDRLATGSDAAAAAVDLALTRFLPMQLDQLRQALSAHPVTLEALPAELTRDWVLPDGRARVQVLSKPAAQESAGLAEFVAQVRSVAPEIGGSAATIVATGSTIVDAFRTASLSAVAAIAVILLLALWRLLDAAMVLAPLLLSALMTVIVLAVLHLSLNYANVIALPLLLGLGVSFNIYFVMNWRAGRPRVLGSATARAILFSALTTSTAFGSLAMSGHPGTASMGVLLLISLGCTLISSLLFIPALLFSVPPPTPR